MRKSQTMVWLNMDMKKYLKHTAIEKNKKMLDLSPDDFESGKYLENKKEKFRFRI